jgi:hypothetical protein
VLIAWMRPRRTDTAAAGGWVQPPATPQTPQTPAS